MKNDRITRLVSFLFLLFVASQLSLFAQMPTKPLSVGIIPKPETIILHDGYIRLDKQSPISIDDSF